MEKIPFETWEYKDQTKMKHQVFNDYIDKWIKIVGKYHKLNYIDGFGGIGAYKDKNGKIFFGSPVLVAEAIEKITSKLRRNVQIVVIDEKKENLDNIEKIFQHKNISIKPLLINEDFDKAINDILDNVSNLAPTFVFVDPFGFKIRMETLERIMKINQSEILLNFMFTRVNQFLSSSKIEKTCNELFGCDDWKKCTALNGHEREACILEALRDRIKKFSKYVYYYKFEFADKKKSFYYLFHLADHYLGCSIMKSSFAKFNFGRVEYRGGRSAQLGIFEGEENAICDATKHLKKAYSGQQKTYQQIVEEQIDNTSFLEKELKTAIKGMEGKGVTISRIPQKTKTGKNRTGIQNNDIIIFS
ncbi:MAG: three-Cys-motif partner protein TcmP [Candidatus Moranbacteria bacterium]|nr:three-Cys-motif partner protein TcmP [Candidatus Moranbacteria bacterium]